jgi:hypothetical protein
LNQFVGSDPQKWAEAKLWIEYGLSTLKEWPADGEVPNWTKADFLRSIQTLLRGKPGAPKKQAFIDRVLELREKGLTCGQIARELLPDLYKAHSERARSRVKKVLSRYGGRKPR